MSRDYRLFLEDMRESGEKILRYTHSMTFEQFKTDEKTLDAVVRNLEIIGEAVKHLPQGIRKGYPEVEWRKIASLCDLAIHEYFGLDEDILWDIIQNKIPQLLGQITRILTLEFPNDQSSIAMSF